MAYQDPADANELHIQAILLGGPRFQYRRYAPSPRKPEALRELELRMARDSPSRGHTRIVGAMANVGIVCSPTPE